MKSWQALLLGIFIGLLAAGLVLLVSKQTEGQAVTLNPPPTAAPLVVYVSGAVSQPGIISLVTGTRVNDAIQAAGGLLPEADVTLLNLAAPLHDGERIWIPAKSDATPIPAIPVNSITPTLSPPSPEHPLNINTATQAELETLPGIGPIRAQAIITYREANGLFTSIDDLMNVPGISQGIFSKLKDVISVQPQP